MHRVIPKIAIATFAVVASLISALAAQAQQATNPPIPATPRAAAIALGAKIAPITELDRHLVTRLISFTEDQITLDRVAQEKGARQDVRLLAAEFIQDHAAMQTVMQNVLATQQPATGNPPPAAAPPPARLPAADHTAATAFVHLSDEVDRQFQQSLRRELLAKQGPQFDDAFLNSQASAQTWLLEALAVYERHVSADLKPMLQRWIQIAQYDLSRVTRLERWIAQVGPNGPAASGIFGPRLGAATSGSAVGTMMTPRPRIGLSPLPTRTVSPTGKTVGPAQGSP